MLSIFFINNTVNHDVLEPFLPFEFDIVVLRKDIQHKLDQVVIIQSEALLFLIKIAVKNDIFSLGSLHILFMQGIEGHGYHIKVVVRFFE